MKNLRVDNIVKEIKFEEVRGELQANNYFQPKSFTKYLRITLVLM